MAPENTLAAVCAAVDADADACEVDVRATRDGQLVLMHDAALDRTTNGSGPLAGATLEEVRRLDAGSWMSRDFSGERVPTLREFLGALAGTRCGAVVEVKEPGLAGKVVEEIADAGMSRRSVVISFIIETLRELRGIEPRLRLGLLVNEDLGGSAEERAGILAARAAESGAEVLDLHHSMLDECLIAELKGRGPLVWAWTVNDRELFAVLRGWGIDGVTTDRPHEIR